MKNAMIVYYSRSGANYVNSTVKYLSRGNTELAVRFLQTLTEIEAFRIEPEQAYPDDYYECIDQARQELKRNIRPSLSSRPDSLKQYDVIYLGYPNYWGTMPMPVFTFLESYDWNGKVIYPFCTHEGGGIGRSCEDLEAICRGARIEPGFTVRGSEVQYELAALKDWFYETLDDRRKDVDAYV